MKDIERRLEALEQQHGTDGPLRVRRIVIAPGGPLPILGWECGEIVTRIQVGESEAACWQRHVAALVQAHGDANTQSIQIFKDTPA